jgi:hypothetical protein
MSAHIWYTVKNGEIRDVRQSINNVSPGPGWTEAPDGWNGGPGDKLEWFDENNRRMTDSVLVEKGLRTDNRGAWYNKETRESKQIHDLDRSPGEGWTRKAPPDAPYQIWDAESDAWVVDAEAKEEAEKQQAVAEKQAAIEEAERRIQRSTRAKLAGTATQEDEQYFTQINAEIETLREQKRLLLSA